MSIPTLPENPTPEQKMAWDALCSQDACNPRGLARELVKLVDHYCERGGTDNSKQPEVRLIIHQLAFLCGGRGLALYDDYSKDNQYGLDTRACRAKLEGVGV